MKKSIKTILSGMLIVPAIALSVSLFMPVTASVSAAVCSDGTTVADGVECAKPENVPECLFGVDCIFSKIVNVGLYVIGALSVLMLIYGGIRYTISGGDSKAVTDAKNTIMYAIIGVVIAMLAYAIINFVLESLIGK